MRTNRVKAGTRRLSRGGLPFCWALLAASFASAGIIGTRHDFTRPGSGWNHSGERCKPCHTPHMAYNPQLIPLWNHMSTTSSFALYGSGTFDGVATITQPGSVSLACLSCHDGTVALENFSGVTTGTTYIFHSNLGTNLGNDHPIGFVYDAALAATDGALHDPTAQPSGLGGTIAEDLLRYDRIECVSCHDPHGRVAGRSLLIKSNVASGLCLTCHRK